MPRDKNIISTAVFSVTSHQMPSGDREKGNK